MDMTFVLQLVVSIIAGGIAIALQTLFAERVSSLWRGVILTIPSTMALGLLFIGLTKTPADVPGVATVIPVVLGIDYVFVMVIVLLARRGLVISILTAAVVWAFGAYLLLQFPPDSFGLSVIYGLALTVGSYACIRTTKHVSLKQFPINAKHIFVRSVMGGLIIGLAVYLSQTLGNIWGGLFSAFPAAFTSTFVIYFYTQGTKAIPVVGKSLFFPGAIGFIVYAWVAAMTFPHVGIWFGTLLAYLATAMCLWVWTAHRKTKLNVTLR
jgi:hypothetical protein